MYWRAIEKKEGGRWLDGGMFCRLDDGRAASFWYEVNYSIRVLFIIVLFEWQLYIKIETSKMMQVHKLSEIYGNVSFIARRLDSPTE